MAHNDGRSIKSFDDFFVAVDGVGNCDATEQGRVGADPYDGAIVDTWPARS